MRGKTSVRPTTERGRVTTRAHGPLLRLLHRGGPAAGLHPARVRRVRHPRPRRTRAPAGCSAVTSSCGVSSPDLSCRETRCRVRSGLRFENRPRDSPPRRFTRQARIERSWSRAGRCLVSSLRAGRTRASWSADERHVVSDGDPERSVRDESRREVSLPAHCFDSGLVEAEPSEIESVVADVNDRHSGILRATPVEGKAPSRSEGSSLRQRLSTRPRSRSLRRPLLGLCRQSRRWRVRGRGHIAHQNAHRTKCPPRTK